MAGDVRGDVTRVVSDLKTGSYVVKGPRLPLKSKVLVERDKKVTRAVPVKIDDLPKVKKGRGKRPIRVWKRSTSPSETTPGPLVIGTINAAPGHRVVPSGRHGIAVTLKVGKADEPRSQVKDFTRRLLAQLELKLNSQLNSIDAADIDLAALGSVDEVARAMLSQLPASHPFDEVIGPFYDVNGAANRLHVSPETMQARAGSNELLACPTAEGDLVFPTFQFNSDGTALPGLGGVLTALAAGTEDRWHVAMWLNTPNELLKGKTPRELLDRGESAVVQKVAEQTAERWCH